MYWTEDKVERKENSLQHYYALLERCEKGVKQSLEKLEDCRENKGLLLLPFRNRKLQYTIAKILRSPYFTISYKLLATHYSIKLFYQTLIESILRNSGTSCFRPPIHLSKKKKFLNFEFFSYSGDIHTSYYVNVLEMSLFFRWWLHREALPNLESIYKYTNINYCYLFHG